MSFQHRDWNQVGSDHDEASEKQQLNEEVKDSHPGQHIDNRTQKDKK